MLSVFLNFYRIKWVRPGFLFNIFFLFLKWFYKLRGVNLEFRPRQFKSANLIEQGGKTSSGYEASVEIYMLASEKDVECLDITIPFAYRSVSGLAISRLVLVVPDSIVEKIEHILGGLSIDFQVRPESSVVSYSDLVTIRNHFGERAGWVYQQTLKLALLQNSVATYALIVDSDTVLLNPREWVKADASIALTPTEEFNDAYFLFLENLGSLIVPPETSFVPHHMFYEISAFQTLTLQLKMDNTARIIEKIKEHSDISSPSPFSLDYEMYAQWSLAVLNPRIRLIRWSNISVSRSKLHFFRKHPRLLRLSGLFYNSLSFHSWN
jgi:hypothetical protein